jgi:hypothetical protein
MMTPEQAKEWLDERIAEEIRAYVYGTYEGPEDIEECVRTIEALPDGRFTAEVTI